MGSKSRLQPKQFLIRIFITNFLDLLAFGMTIPVFAFLFLPESGGVFYELYNADQLAKYFILVVAGFSVGTLIGSPFLGSLSDRFGRRNILLFIYTCLLFSYIITIYCILAKSVVGLVTIRVLGGMFGGALLVIQSSIADISANENKTKDFGIIGIAFGLGFVFGALFGSVLSDPNNHPLFSPIVPFIVAIAVQIINVLFLIFFFKETLQTRSTKKIDFTTGPRNVVKAFMIPYLRNLFIVVYLVTLAFNFYVQMFQLYVMDTFDFSRTDVGFLFAFLGLSVAISQGILLPLATRKFSDKQLLNLSIPLFTLTYLGLLLAPTWQLFCILMFVFALAQGLTFPPLLTLVSNQAAAHNQGEVIGINQAVQSLAAATPIAFYFFIDSQYNIAMYVGIIITFLAWLFYRFFVINQFK